MGARRGMAAAARTSAVDWRPAPVTTTDWTRSSEERLRVTATPTAAASSAAPASHRLRRWRRSSLARCANRLALSRPAPDTERPSAIGVVAFRCEVTDDADLGMQQRAARLVNCPAHLGYQGVDVGSQAGRLHHDEIGVPLADLGPAVTPPFQAGRLDQPAG